MDDKKKKAPPPSSATKLFRRLNTKKKLRKPKKLSKLRNTRKVSRSSGIVGRVRNKSAPSLDSNEKKAAFLQDSRGFSSDSMLSGAKKIQGKVSLRFPARAETVRSSLLPGRSSLLSCVNKAGAMSVANTSSEVNWVLPQRQEEEGRREYVLRPVDVAFVHSPSFRVRWNYRKEIDRQSVLEALQRAVDMFPLVAGRLALIEKEPEVTEEDRQMWEVFGQTEEEVLGELEADTKLYSVVDFEAAESGVLFESVEVFGVSLKTFSSDMFFCERKSPFQTKEPLLKVKLTCSEDDKSVLAVDFSRVLGDWTAFSSFMFALSVFVTESGERVYSPCLDRKQKVDTRELIQGNSLSVEKLRFKAADSGLQNFMRRSNVHWQCKKLCVPVSLVEQLQAEYTESFERSLSNLVDDSLEALSYTDVLTAIGVLLWRGLKCPEKREAKVLLEVDTRGRTQGAPFEYFGTASVFPELSFDFEEDSKARVSGGVLTFQLKSVLSQLLVMKRRLFLDKSKLSEMELKFEKLFEDVPQVSAAVNAKYPAEQRKMLPFALHSSAENLPVFSSSVDLENKLFDLKFRKSSSEKGGLAANFVVDDLSLCKNSVAIMQTNTRNFSIKYFLDSSAVKRWDSAIESLLIGL